MTDLSSLVTMMLYGVVLTNVAAVTFAMVTKRTPALAFEEGDSNAIGLALAFRIVAAPGILVYGFMHDLYRGAASSQAAATLAAGLLWGAIYGVGLGVVA
ncbi:MAG: hypothetical protein AAFZ01_13080 [Pseudomonadota bacterium]